MYDETQLLKVHTTLHYYLPYTFDHFSLFKHTTCRFHHHDSCGPLFNRCRTHFLQSHVSFTTFEICTLCIPLEYISLVFSSTGCKPARTMQEFMHCTCIRMRGTFSKYNTPVNDCTLTAAHQYDTDQFHDQTNRRCVLTFSCERIHTQFVN